MVDHFTAITWLKDLFELSSAQCQGEPIRPSAQAAQRLQDLLWTKKDLLVTLAYFQGQACNAIKPGEGSSCLLA